jgi:hypothetical protein
MRKNLKQAEAKMSLAVADPLETLIADKLQILATQRRRKEFRACKTASDMLVEASAANEQELLRALRFCGWMLGHGPMPHIVHGTYRNQLELTIGKRRAVLYRRPMANAMPLPGTRMSWKMRVVYYGIALRMLEPALPFTVRLSTEVHQRACDSPRGYTRYLHRHLSQTLERGIGFVPHFFFVTESDIAHGVEPHLHGGIGIASRPTRMQVKVRHLIRQAAGKFPNPNARRYQIRFGEFTDLIGWGGYISKDFDATNGEIDGRLVSATASVSKLARKVYEEDRALILSLYEDAPASVPMI